MKNVMKTKTLGMFAIPSLTALMVIGAFAPMAMAASDHSAIIELDIGLCGMQDGDGGDVFTTNKVKVETMSNSGVVVLKCFFDDVPNSTGKAVVERGLDCGITLPSGGFVLTDNTQRIISESGEGTLTCIYKE